MAARQRRTRVPHAQSVLAEVFQSQAHFVAGITVPRGQLAQGRQHRRRSPVQQVLVQGFRPSHRWRRALAEHRVGNFPHRLPGVPDVEDLDHLDARQPEERLGTVPDPRRAVTDGRHPPHPRSPQTLCHRQGVGPVPEVPRVLQPYREVRLPSAKRVRPVSGSGSVLGPHGAQTATLALCQAPSTWTMHPSTATANVSAAAGPAAPLRVDHSGLLLCLRPPRRCPR